MLLLAAVGAMMAVTASVDDNCFMRDCNSVAFPEITYMDGTTGRPISFDCSDAVKRCRTDTVHCRYSLVWTRYAGCGNGQVPASGRFDQSTHGPMRIAGVEPRDAGLWGCEVRSFNPLKQITTTITYRVFLLHVDERGLTCAAETCAKQSVCYQILRTGSRSDAAVPPPQRGCARLDRIPKDVFNGLAGQPTKSCKSERASPQYCSWTGRYSSASNYVCCWCFSNACDQRSSIRQDTIELAFRGSDDSCTELARLHTSQSPSLVAAAAFQTTGDAPPTSRNCVIPLLSACLSLLFTASQL